jgi:hypothetical protein
VRCRRRRGVSGASGAFIEHAFDGVVIGIKSDFGAARGLGGVDIAIACNGDAIAHLWDRGRIVGWTIAVDENPRIAREHRGRIEECAQTPGERARADVPGDVALERVVLQPEIIPGDGYAVAGMVADEQERCDSLRIEDFDGWRIALGHGHRVGVLGRRHVRRASRDRATV